MKMFNKIICSSIFRYVWAAIFGVVLAATGSVSASEVVDINVTSLIKVSETRINRTEYDYVFKLALSNGEVPLKNAAQKLIAAGQGTQIIDGDVAIGNLTPHQTITSSDTITIRHNRSHPFNQSSMVWQASGEVFYSLNTIARAFPGAEGFGAKTTGGRGGDIYYVTSLADTDTPGTLRYAVNRTGKRTILFAVSGYIQLTKNLEIVNGDVSILGQTAPGDGITLRGAALRIKEGTNNVVIRFIRSRPGQVPQEVDALDGRYLNNIIVDHSSFSWAIDETASLYASNNVTFQWNIVSESLNNSGHEKGSHGYGGNWGGVNTSFHHNMLAHHKSRNPRIDGILDKWTANKTIPSVDGVADIRNNIIYNNVQYPPYGAEGRDVQFINNYYKPGPATVASGVKNFIVLASGRRPLYEEDRTATLNDYNAQLAAGTLDPKFLVNGAVAKPVGRVFVEGNFLQGNPQVTTNNVDGVRYDDASLKELIIQSTAFVMADHAKVNTHSPDDAFGLVVQSSGASLRRDAIDSRVVSDVVNGTGTNGASGNGIIDSPNDVGGYPTLNSAAAPLDTDLDGMPDAWELANGLNPHSAADNWEMFTDLHGLYPEVKGLYSNAEVYWYSLVKHIPGAGVEAAVYIPSSSSSSSIASSAEFLSSLASLSSSSASSAVIVPVSSSSSSVASSSAQSSIATVFSCPATGLYFCDDFSGGLNTANWDVKAAANNVAPQANGVFDIYEEQGNKSLRFTASSSGGVLLLLNQSVMNSIPSADYFIEAKIRPRTNSTTSDKHLYMLARYVDDNNWYGGGLNVQNATTSTRVENAKRINGAVTQMTRFNTPIEQAIRFDSCGSNCGGQWYTVRYELTGNQHVIYLNGEKVGSNFTDATYSGKGFIGLYTKNKSFEIDDIKIGNANDKPPQLNISPAAVSYASEVNNAPYVVMVSAKKPDLSEDEFSVVSSDTNVVAINRSGNQVNLVPVGAGSATITFISNSEPNLTRSIIASIAPQFVQSPTVYNLNGLTQPAVNAVESQVDGKLRITFDSPPTLASAGSIRIYKLSDDSVVDTIKLVDEKLYIGSDPTRLRTINAPLVEVEGNSLYITPHKTLDYGTSYYVSISPGAITNAAIGGLVFDGLGKAAGWIFTTKPNAPSGTVITVDDDAPADFSTLQGALNYVMANIPINTETQIHIKNGIYEEPLLLRNKNNLTISGESQQGVQIRYKNNNTLNPGAGGTGTADGALGGRAVWLIESVDNLVLEHFTLTNTTLIGEGGQAETIYFNSDQGRLIGKYISLISEQDTISLKGYNWFYRSLIAGNVDFIWGGNRVSLFEESEIRSLGDSRGNGGGGYVLQARTPTVNDKGYVFLNSNFTRGPGPLGHNIPDGQSVIGRTGGSSSFDSIALINCKVDAHIKSNAFTDTPSVVGSANSGLRQFNTQTLSGSPLDISGWTHFYSLTEEEVMSDYSSRAAIFSNFGNGSGWNPQP
ncbi:pectinesterase family protein [Cellvibrio sp. KY-YJ-3]|uniref:pectinesterase family protein n=1 Tax=Cellvibrio sp. KY-YJ-3 TaxID=454662 RepID=UPI0012479749|nr:pectinesterase family protein [Cellvibrio sp. KY-YJ-3]QEY13685.1 hypothetical protein D0B88_16365 [Cellvibrio sp. KY-YJ-3]